MRNTYCTLGADPELFITDRRGKPVPAHTVGLPHKLMPVEFDDGEVLRDGYALELNPRHDVCRVIVSSHYWSLLSEVRASFLGRGLQLIAKSAVEIDLGSLEGAPEDVSMFGCDGAWNAYSGKIVRPSIHGPTHPYRYTGGHFHGAFYSGHSIPWAKRPEDVFLWAKMEDRFLGLISTYLTGSEWLGLRRLYYGQAGEFRFQDHKGTVAALEYRTPGSEVFSHPVLLNFCFGLFREVYENFDHFKEHYGTDYENEVKDAINAGQTHNDLLDLIPEIPGWYSKKLLRRARQFFRPKMHKNLVPNLDKYLNQASMGRGWAEWCREVGYVHYRDVYFGGDGYQPPISNPKWGERIA